MALFTKQMLWHFHAFDTTMYLSVKILAHCSVYLPSETEKETGGCT